MILIINLAKEKLHKLEFVKPIQQILKESKIKHKIIHYNELKEKNIKEADKIILSGTSLKDNDYLNHLDKFNFLLNTNKSILGICAGCHIITSKLKGELKNDEEIGMIKISLKKKTLGLSEEENVYSLHNIGIKKLPENFETLATYKNKSQIIKHKKKEIYGILFHPEVNNKIVIKEFCKD